jgi:hypothetical protein
MKILVIFGLSIVFSLFQRRENVSCILCNDFSIML